jgi:hypothetical protein
VAAHSIENLDADTWSELVLAEATLDLKRCELPAGHSKFTPSVPVAVEELGRAAEELRTIVSKQKPDTTRRDANRAAAIGFLAQAFQEECSFALRAPAVYRKELLAFLRVALKAGGFKAPEPRKTWQLLGRFASWTRKPRSRMRDKILKEQRKRPAIDRLQEGLSLSLHELTRLHFGTEWKSRNE